jgi:hypothetical protein
MEPELSLCNTLCENMLGAANLKLTVSILWSLEDVIFLGCDTMSLGEWFLTFGGHFHLLKLHELRAQQNCHRPKDCASVATLLQEPQISHHILPLQII